MNDEAKASVVVVAGLLLWFAFALVVSIHGLMLAWKASAILFVVALLVEPAPFIFGAMDWFLDVNVAQLLMEAVK